MTIKKIRELLATCESQSTVVRGKAMFSDTSSSIDHLAKITTLLSQACLQLLAMLDDTHEEAATTGTSTWAGRSLLEIERQKLAACRHDLMEWRKVASHSIPDDAPEHFRGTCTSPDDLGDLLTGIYDWGKDATITCGELRDKLEKCEASKESPKLSREWLQKAGDIEDASRSVSVGGLASDLNLIAKLEDDVVRYSVRYTAQFQTIVSVPKAATLSQRDLEEALSEIDIPEGPGGQYLLDSYELNAYEPVDNKTLETPK